MRRGDIRLWMSDVPLRMRDVRIRMGGVRLWMGDVRLRISGIRLWMSDAPFRIRDDRLWMSDVSFRTSDVRLRMGGVPDWRGRSRERMAGCQNFTAENPLFSLHGRTCARSNSRAHTHRAAHKLTIDQQHRTKRHGDSLERKVRLQPGETVDDSACPDSPLRAPRTYSPAWLSPRPRRVGQMVMRSRMRSRTMSVWKSTAPRWARMVAKSR